MTIEAFEKSMQAYHHLETATFGMGCFWSPDARFGSLPGVIRTRVGYAGGTTEAPTYRKMGDHTETLQIDFDPDVLSYEAVLKVFWRNHYPNRDEYKGRQYISLLHYHTKGQHAAVQKVKSEMEAELGESIETEIGPYQGFVLAEPRHQKYYLKRYPKAMDQLKDLYPNEALLVNSTFAARLNGFAKGFGSRAALVEEIAGWKMDESGRNKLIERLMALKW